MLPVLFLSSDDDKSDFVFQVSVLNSTLQVCSNADCVSVCCVQLGSLPAEIGQLRRLRVLFAYRNRLTEVPEELGACTQLEVVQVLLRDYYRYKFCFQFPIGTWISIDIKYPKKSFMDLANAY